MAGYRFFSPLWRQEKKRVTTAFDTILQHPTGVLSAEVGGILEVIF
jgi:hypothetical protein